MRTWAQGYHKDKNKFCEKLQVTVVSKDEKLDTLEQLNQRWTDTDSSESTKTKLSLDLSGFSTLERDDVWNERIAGSGASRLAALIEHWGNADWVSTGRRYLHSDNCPFCQQRLPKDFTDELAGLLDGDRQKRVDHLTGLVSDYAAHFEELRTAIESAQTEPLVKSEPTFKTAWEALRHRLQSNLTAMLGKQEKPRDPIQLELTTTVGADLNTAIDRVNERIAAFNVRVADRRAEKERVKEAFWKFLRRDREEAFVSYEAFKKPLEISLNDYKTKLTKSRIDIEALETQLANLREHRTGVDAAVQKINAKLKSLGVGTFSIEKKPGENNLYCLARPGQRQGDLRSLSEGEKTLISFLYYVVLLNGSETAQVEFPLDKTVAVIDDPISSLSHNFIFDIASILQHEVIKPLQGQPRARQVLVLTHNLFFLHELLKQGNKHSVLLRVLKNPYTSVEPFNAGDLLNDYDALWQTLRDARDGKVSKQAVPNTMRCILEHFLWFTQRDTEFKLALEALTRQDQNFRPLARFLDRGSHQDATNISVMDYGQFDVDYYLGKFREVFAALDFAGHYDSRMAVAS
jgi:wobble nucleotide-excising tRNase